jgi:hypothetical protein
MNWIFILMKNDCMIGLSVIEKTPRWSRKRFYVCLMARGTCMQGKSNAHSRRCAGEAARLWRERSARPANTDSKTCDFFSVFSVRLVRKPWKPWVPQVSSNTKVYLCVVFLSQKVVIKIGFKILCDLQSYFNEGWWQNVLFANILLSARFIFSFFINES